MSYHGYNPIQAVEDFALPNATTGYSTVMTRTGVTNHKLRLLVIAQTAISIATGQAFSIEFMAGSTSTPTANPKAEMHTYLVHKTSADSTLPWAAGEVMVDYALPESILATTDVYFRFLFTTDANESSELVDILLVGDV